MLDSREPPNGDFVAYVERIEREQLARAMRPHRLPHLSTGGKVATEESGTRSLGANEAQRVLQALQAQGRTGRAPAGALIGVALGAGLIAFGLLAEGGIILVLLGAALLWHNLRKLHRARPSAPASPAQQVDTVFARKGAGPAGRGGG